MVNIFQILLSAVIVALASVLILVGIQIYLLLKEVQRTIQKVNATLDEARGFMATTSRSLTNAATGMTSFLGGLKTVLQILNVFKKKDAENG